jgi:glyoxylase-like metal-dependent hydrolase (beta-lactamase superfamily II)
LNNTTYSFKLGDFQCSVINDGFRAWTSDALICGEKTQEQLVRVALEFELDLEAIPVPDNSLMVNTGDQNVLIDVGSCKRPWPGLKEGNTLHNLKSLGFNPDDIDAIIITHSDNDHIGGILDKEGQLEFPNARYYLSANSWRYWSSSEGRSQMAELTGTDWSEWIDFVWGTYSTIQDRLTIVDYEVEFLPGFHMYPAIGHRYDHDVLKIESSSEKLIHIADSLLSPLFMAVREWYYCWDLDPEKAIETKERLLEWCTSEEALVFASHFPFPGLGTIHKQDDIWHWDPVKA